MAPPGLNFIAGIPNSGRDGNSGCVERLECKSWCTRGRLRRGRCRKYPREGRIFSLTEIQDDIMTFVTHIPSLETSKAVFENVTEKQMIIRAITIRGRSQMTSVKFLGFWTPSPLVSTKFTQTPFLLSEFGQPPLPPHD